MKKSKEDKNQRYVGIVTAVLGSINDELERCNWNKNQTEISSPFYNTGQKYSNDVFSVRSYYWGDDENKIRLPNFEYKDFKVYWYKHLGRGLTIEYKKDIDIDFISQMQMECIVSIWKDFKEINDEEDL